MPIPRPRQPLKTTDSVMALNLDTGKPLWVSQDTENDVWLAGCGPPNPSENCPKEIGPDYDFGSSPILRALPNGRRILVAGQKSGIVWAHDPDKQGAVVWKVQLVEELDARRDYVRRGRRRPKRLLWFEHRGHRRRSVDDR